VKVTHNGANFPIKQITTVKSLTIETEEFSFFSVREKTGISFNDLGKINKQNLFVGMQSEFLFPN
jgi:hypothetical protein